MDICTIQGTGVCLGGRGVSRCQGCVQVGAGVGGTAPSTADTFNTFTPCIRNRSTAQHSAVQYYKVQYGTVRRSTLHYSNVQYSTIHHSIVIYNIIQYILAHRCITVQCCTIEYIIVLLQECF